VVLNAMAAREKGAHIHTRPAASALVAQGPVAPASGARRWQPVSIRAKALVNAAGPGSPSSSDDLKLESPYGIRLIQGSHLIVPKLYEGEHATSCRTKTSASSSPFLT
jgi:glycerol-3-phosphate dehydrogenase